jgi:glucose-1-phosphate cytidylyltransferase
LKAVILAGGYGTRLSEETMNQPKPMVTIGDRPIIWHIMKIFEHHGISEFVICCGYKGYVLKEYFANYYLHNSDFKIDLADASIEIISRKTENWKITLVDTGLDTQTGGRLKRVSNHLNETFFMTYGDGVSDINITKLLAFHRSHGKHATVTSVQPPGRFGAIKTNGSLVTEFAEKAEGAGSLINGGFFVLEPNVFDYITGDSIAWEGAPVAKLISELQLVSYKHEGFWRPMDTLRDKNALEEAWASGTAAWKVWS